MPQLEYVIRYRPQSFYVRERTTDLGVKCWDILTDQNQPIGFFFEKNMAYMALFALELVHARVRGDRAKEREINRAIDKLMELDKGRVH